jgi:predicted nucleic acid-binding protein
MILVDTSIWIAILHREISVDADDYEEFNICGPVLQEVLQGFADTPLTTSYAKFLMDVPRLSDPLTSTLFVHAADIYRQGRRRGLTIRTAADCLIVAIALENDATLWHCNRDFDNIAQFTNLKVRRSLY